MVTELQVQAGTRSLVCFTFWIVYSLQGTGEGTLPTIPPCPHCPSATPYGCRGTGAASFLLLPLFPVPASIIHSALSSRHHSLQNGPALPHSFSQQAFMKHLLYTGRGSSGALTVCSVQF